MIALSPKRTTTIRKIRCLILAQLERYGQDPARAEHLVTAEMVKISKLPMRDLRRVMREL